LRNYGKKNADTNKPICILAIKRELLISTPPITTLEIIPQEANAKNQFLGIRTIYIIPYFYFFNNTKKYFLNANNRFKSSLIYFDLPIKHHALLYRNSRFDP